MAQWSFGKCKDTDIDRYRQNSHQTSQHDLYEIDIIDINSYCIYNMYINILYLVLYTFMCSKSERPGLVKLSQPGRAGGQELK